MYCIEQLFGQACAVSVHGQDVTPQDGLGPHELQSDPMMCVGREGPELTERLVANARLI
jgi:hypothetical protein